MDPVEDIIRATSRSDVSSGQVSTPGCIASETSISARPRCSVPRSSINSLLVPPCRDHCRARLPRGHPKNGVRTIRPLPDGGRSADAGADRRRACRRSCCRRRPCPAGRGPRARRGPRRRAPPPRRADASAAARARRRPPPARRPRQACLRSRRRAGRCRGSRRLRGPRAGAAARPPRGRPQRDSRASSFSAVARPPRVGSRSQRSASPSSRSDAASPCTGAVSLSSSTSRRARHGDHHRHAVVAQRARDEHPVAGQDAAGAEPHAVATKPIPAVLM